MNIHLKRGKHTHRVRRGTKLLKNASKTATYCHTQVSENVCMKTTSQHQDDVLHCAYTCSLTDLDHVSVNYIACTSCYVFISTLGHVLMQPFMQLSVNTSHLHEVPKHLDKKKKRRNLDSPIAKLVVKL